MTELTKLPRVRPNEKAPVRMVIFPAEWFDALYTKVGWTYSTM